MAIRIIKSCTGASRKINDRSDEYLYQIRARGTDGLSLTIYTGYYDQCERKIAKLRAANAGVRYQLSPCDGY